MHEAWKKHLYWTLTHSFFFFIIIIIFIIIFIIINYNIKNKNNNQNDQFVSTINWPDWLWPFKLKLIIKTHLHLVPVCAKCWNIARSPTKSVWIHLKINLRKLVWWPKMLIENTMRFTLDSSFSLLDLLFLSCLSTSNCPYQFERISSNPFTFNLIWLQIIKKGIWFQLCKINLKMASLSVCISSFANAD